MSGQIATQTRRDIRRAMGPEALDLVGQQAKAIGQLQEGLKRAALEADWVRHDLAMIETRHESTHDRVTAFISRSFWGRLRWLVIGR